MGADFPADEQDLVYITDQAAARGCLWAITFTGLFVFSIWALAWDTQLGTVAMLVLIIGVALRS